jgi:hypothetical protein
VANWAGVLLFLAAVYLGTLLELVMWRVHPRKGVPSRMQRLRALEERARLLTQREQEWMRWASFAAGKAHALGVDLPPYPGTPGWNGQGSQAH